MNLTSKRKCPNCGLDSKHSTLEVKAKNPAENLTAKQLEDFFVGFRKDQCFFTYFRCACGLLWCPEYFHPEAIKDLYKSIPENNLVSGDKNSKKTQIAYVDLIFKMNEIASPVLEIGPDVGDLTGEIIARKPDITAYAIEPNELVLSKLATRLGSKKNIFGDLSELPSNIRPRLIVAVHVMDHLIDPKSYLQELISISSTGLEIFIIVHNESSLLRKILKNRWAPFCLQHPQIYNVRTLTSLLESVGFTNIRNRNTSNWISSKQIGVLLESISVMPSGISKLIPNVSMPLNLGNFAISAHN